MNDKLLTMVFFDLVLPMLGELAPEQTLTIKDLFQEQPTLKAKRKVLSRSSDFIRIAIERTKTGEQPCEEE